MHIEQSMELLPDCTYLPVKPTNVSNICDQLPQQVNRDRNEKLSVLRSDI